MRLSDLHNGESAVIIKVFGHGGFRKRITEMGFVRGRVVLSVMDSPLKDPVKYSIMGYEVSLRRREAEMVEVLYESEIDDQIALTNKHEIFDDEYYKHVDNAYITSGEHVNQAGVKKNGIHHPETDSKAAFRKNIINIALVGNPNSGKTSLFNALSGGSEHVGNYSGVTISSKTGHFNYNGYHFNITDLPGTYSLSAYTPEERFVRDHIFGKMPDVIINPVVASNLERNLYLTTELIDLNPRMVVALNMFDELEESGAKLDYEKLEGMIGVPMVPTVAKNKTGLENLLNTVIDVFEGRNKVARHIHINYGTVTEPEISVLNDIIRKSEEVPQQFPARYWAIKLIENDSEAAKVLEKCAGFNKWKSISHKSAVRIEHQANNDIETVISDAKYGFIAGAMQETYIAGTHDANRKTRFIDSLVANQWLGFPIFILLMWVMFMATFYIGAFPQEWIEIGVEKLSEFISSVMPEGPLRELLAGGIIGGVGSVIVFLPNILILYIFISFMEDSGYMARAAFIMDRIMHKMGLHGKSFIPLIMGFGCNVPAIMATRTIESHSSRIITILINPFISCSARIPVLLLFAGTFFPNYAGTAMISMYLFGMFIAVITAKGLRKTRFKVDETPFVMELPPYRMPTINSTFRHMWDKGKQYLKKMGSVILLASIIIWFLSYYPHNESLSGNNALTEQAGANTKTMSATPADQSSDLSEQADGQTEQQVEDKGKQLEQSYLGRIGKLIEPVMKPLGLDWKASVSILTGAAAKEIVVSTLGVLYHNEDEATLSKTLVSSGDFTKRSALAFMVFILLYFPCIAALAAINSEAGRKWALFSIVYNTTLAWIIAFTVYTVAGLFY